MEKIRKNKGITLIALVITKKSMDTAKQSAGWTLNSKTNEYEPVQKYSAYTGNSKAYPKIYEQEEYSVITTSSGTTTIAKGNGLSLSDENPNGLLKRAVGRLCNKCN